MTDVSIGIAAMTDGQLVELVRRGDRQAFDELIRRHRRMCVDVASLYLRNRSDAEDQTQIAFLKAYEHFDQYRGDAGFSVWLARIVANECMMLLRSRRRAHFVYLDQTASDTYRPRLQLPARGPNPEGEYASRQMNRLLEAEVRRIPPLMRNVMLLRDIKGLPMTDVAARLGITVPAAKSRLVRARTEMRSRLTQRHRLVRKLQLARATAV